VNTNTPRKAWQSELGHAVEQAHGVFARDERTADADSVLLAIEDAREEALRRELGQES